RLTVVSGSPLAARIVIMVCLQADFLPPSCVHRDMKQYLDLCQRIISEGEWVTNERTGKRCLTLINADLTYDVANNQFPLITTRKSYWKAAIAELLGYLRGYDSAAQFRAIGCNTWNANANDNQAWLSNPHRK